MSLIICPECGVQTTDRVNRCVRCGCGHVAHGKSLNKLRKAGALEEKCTAFDWAKLAVFVFAILALIFVFGENIVLMMRPAASVLYSMVRDVLFILTNIGGI